MAAARAPPSLFHRMASGLVESGRQRGWRCLLLTPGDMIKEHAMLLSVFLLFKFLSKYLIIAALADYTIRGIAVLCATLPRAMNCFLTKECNYKEVAASIPGVFFCMWYAMKFLANNVLEISSPIQGIEMLSQRSHKTGAIFMLLFAYSVWPSTILTIGDGVIPGTFVAIALRIAVTRVRKNRFFNCAFLLYIVGSTIIIIMANLFQAGQVAPAVIGFVAVYCFCNCEVKQDGMNQLMGKVWDWKNMYETKLKKFHGSVLAANEDGGRCQDDTAAPQEDLGDDPTDDKDWLGGHHAVQFLAIKANYPIFRINGYDFKHGQRIYSYPDSEIEEDGMLDLVPSGPRDTFFAYAGIYLKIYYYRTADADREQGPLAPVIRLQMHLCDNKQTTECKQTILLDRGGFLELTYLVIPKAVQAEIEVSLKLKDLGSRCHGGRSTVPGLEMWLKGPVRSPRRHRRLMKNNN